jgi:nucleoside diphosphate kinase
MAQQTRDAEELAYALVTPYSLHKSRTGGILARLLWANVELVAARMYAPKPGSGFIEAYCDAIYDPQERDVPLKYQRMIIEYVVKNFGKPNVRGISNRLALLVFRGPNAQKETAAAVGHIRPGVRGDDVRGTFGDFLIEDPDVLDYDPAYQERRRLLSKYSKLREAELPVRHNAFFEPAALTGTTPQMNRAHLELFRKYAYSDGGFVLDAVEGADAPDIETSMVILKPESFRNRNPLPGNLIDFFAHTGMFITAMKVIEMDVNRARDFYGLKLPQFRQQLKGMVGQRARRIVKRARALSDEAIAHLGAEAAVARDPRTALAAVKRMETLFAGELSPGEVKPPVLERIYDELARRLTDLDPPDAVYDELSEDLKDVNAQAEFNELIRYMTGKDPETHEPTEPGQQTRCMAILYSGRGALSVIRKRLKQLRVVYGTNVLQNRAHASDPEEFPEQEREVLGMPASASGESTPCDVERVIAEFHGPQ